MTSENGIIVFGWDCAILCETGTYPVSAQIQNAFAPFVQDALLTRHTDYID